MKDSSIPAYMTYVEAVGIHPKQNMTWVNNMAVINPDGKLERIGHGGCFSGIYHLGAQPWDYILLQVNDKQAYGSGSNKEVLHTYYEWLLNYSLFHSSFVSKDIGKVMKDRVIVIDPEVDSKLVINSMVAARMAWEGQYNTSTRIVIWYDMIKMGVDPAQAFTLCSCMTSEKGLYKMQANNNHEVLESTNDVIHLNFLEHKLNPEGESFKKCGGYKSISSLFLSNRDNGFSPWAFITDHWPKVEKSLWGEKVMGVTTLNRDTFLGTLKEISTDYTSKLKELKVNVV